jgi:hypothetical protein
MTAKIILAAMALGASVAFGDPGPATTQRSHVPYPPQPGQPEGMVIMRASGPESGRLLSHRVVDGGQRIVPHGLTVVFGPDGVQRSEHYDMGRLISQTDYWPGTTMPFRHITVDLKGNGFILIHTYSHPTGEPVQGDLRAGKPWRGRFLESHVVPNTFGVVRMRWVDYADGLETKSTDTDFAELGVPDHIVQLKHPDPSKLPRPWKVFFEWVNDRWSDPLSFIAEHAGQ